MALFRRPGGEGSAEPGKSGGGSGAVPAPAFSPDKARKFFEHAAANHETTNYEYAMTLWLDGLRLDPASLAGLEGFFKSTAELLGTKEGAKGPRKETIKQYSGARSELDRFLYALLQWGIHPGDAGSGVRATSSAAALGLHATTRWLGERALAKAMADRRPRKEWFTALMEAFKRFGDFDLAIKAGEEGVRADPADGKLHAEVRNMSAQATMTKGGFDQAGESGGFRANIRDAEKQRRLDEEERMVRGELTADRVVADARAAYQARPDDRPSITRYAKALLDRGTPADEQTAREVLLRAYEQTQEFRFRQMAGDIGLRQAKRQLAALEKQGAEAARIEQARRALAELEAREYQARVAAYPTDLGLKLELGRRLLALDRHEEAIAVLQEAKADVKNRPKVLGHLGTAFEAIGWTDEAIETYRLALDPAHAPVGGVDETTAMELRYGLMRALEARANESGDLASADEAYKLASSIAMEQISYKDVRARREALKQLAARLREAGGAATR